MKVFDIVLPYVVLYSKLIGQLLCIEVAPR